MTVLIIVMKQQGKFSKSFGCKISEIIKDGKLEKIASGSIGQVYKV